MMKVPKFQDPDVTKFFEQFLREKEGSDKDVLSSTTGNRSLLLYSPSLKVFEVKVTDAGALTVTKVSGT